MGQFSVQNLGHFWMQINRLYFNTLRYYLAESVQGNLGLIAHYVHMLKPNYLIYIMNITHPSWAPRTNADPQACFYWKPSHKVYPIEGPLDPASNKP